VAVTVRSVSWLDPAALALRAGMAEEMTRLYTDVMADEAVPAALRVAEEQIAYTGLAVDEHGTPVGHLALCRHGRDLEMKRVYVTPSARGNGVAAALLAAADEAAAELGAARIVLQTGDRQPGAVRMYRRAGYLPIPVFPPYQRLAFSLCFAKAVTIAARDGRTPHRC
jgi:GNAT superfamily N-acetyltransferase